MTIAELRELLFHLPIPEDAYSLDDPTRNEAYVLENLGAEWAVYYSERGRRTGERRYPSEDAACQALLRRLSSTFIGE